MKRVCVVGGGISGLNAAYKLHRKGCPVVLFEKKEWGGWLGKGPKTIRGEAPCSVQLLEELGLDVIESSPAAEKRFLWLGKKLVPFSMGSLMRYGFFWKIMGSLLKEPWISPKEEDETLEEFVIRRLGKTAARYLFDPLVAGIYGARSCSEVSVGGAFPQLKEMEQKKGSLAGAFLSSSKKKKKPLLTPLGGMQQWVQAFLKKLPEEVLCQQEVISLEFFEEPAEKKKRVRFQTRAGQSLDAEFFFSALPAHTLAPLLETSGERELLEAAALLRKIVYGSIVRVELTLAKKCTPSGFGYLVPSLFGEPTLGVIFDSEVFPNQEEESRLTVMLSDTPEVRLDPVGVAKKQLERQIGLSISCEVISSSCKIFEKAIPKPGVGHKALIAEVKKRIASFPIALAGDFIEQPGIEKCLEVSDAALAQMSVWGF